MVEAGGFLPVLERRPAWTELDRRARGTRFIAVEARTVVNSSKATGMKFWSINPYIGCEFGCAYCYARDTHRWTVERAGAAPDAPAAVREVLEIDPAVAFERRVLVKQHAAARLARTLEPARLGAEALVIGTATDPYQPAERRFRITRAILETLLQFRDLQLGIITKSPLIVRDLDLLRALAGRHRLSVNISLAAADAALLRRLEPRTPTPRARLRALRRLADAGISAGILIAPILPGITDGRAALRALIRSAHAAGASWAAGVPLRMGPATRRTFLPWIDRERPAIAARYHRHFSGRRNTSRAYQSALQSRLRSLRGEFGIDDRRQPAREAPPPPHGEQLAFW